MREILHKFITAQAITRAFQKAEEQGEIPVMPLEQFFPNVSRPGNKIAYIKRANGAPVLLRASTYEDEATLRGRLSASMKEDEMPYFKEGMKLEGTQLLDLAKVSGLPAEHDLFAGTIKALYRDRVELVKGAYGRAEWLRSQAISGENIAIDNNGVVKVIDYDLEAEQVETLTLDDRWGVGASPDIIGDIENHKKICQAREGIVPDLMMMNSTTFGVMASDDAVVALVKQNVTNVQPITYISPNMIKQAVQSILGVTILINDEIHQTEVGGTKVKYIADNKVILFSSKVKLGNTCWGTTPESLLPPSEGEVESVNGEVTVTTDWENNPVSKTVIASMVCLPSGEGLSTIQVINVA